MRSFVAALAGVVVLASSVLAAKVEVKGPHICCKRCVKVAVGLLEKVDGVSDAAADIKTKTVTFTAKNKEAAAAGIQALLDGGFFGTPSIDGEQGVFARPTVPGAGEKRDVVTIKGVHVCCGQCETGVNKLFSDAKVSFDGPGPQKTVRIEGANRTVGAVLEALQKGGFNGTPEK